MEDRWAKLEEIVRRVLREELSTAFQQKPVKPKIRFENGKFLGIGELETAALVAAYPAVQVEKELREMGAWIMLNPNEAPKSNYGAFINRWLTKHQNAASLRSISSPRVVAQKICGYCERPAICGANGIPTCGAHLQSAMDQKPVKVA